MSSHNNLLHRLCTLPLFETDAVIGELELITSYLEPVPRPILHYPESMRLAGVCLMDERFQYIGPIVCARRSAVTWTDDLPGLPERRISSRLLRGKARRHRTQ